MPKVKAQAQAHTSVTPNQEVNMPISHEDSTSSDHESESEISFHPSRQEATFPVRQQMFMPYIEAPKMDWTVNDSLYHCFLKWKLKCKNILKCEVATLPECQQYKKLIAWSGDFGKDQYVSWGLTKDELELETIWSHFEEFCKPKSKEVHARFDLLTSFCQGCKSLDEWYNCVQAQINLAKYSPETAKILHRDIFWFYLRDEDLYLKPSMRAVLSGQVPSKQGVPACKEILELKSYGQAYQASAR